MKSTEFIRVEDFCSSVRDGTHDTPKPADFGYRLVTGKHIKNGQIDPGDAYYISKDDYNKINERSLVEKWDVLMSMIGTVGEVAVIKDVPDYAIKNVALFKCGGSELKGRWLSYYLRTPFAKGHMTGNQKGSSQQFLSLKQLRDLPVPVVDEREMQTTVNILSAYDDLIENNQKQIKLLEEAAQRLYKEWFIDLRFPGYENTPAHDGVPEGWMQTTVGELCSVRKNVVSPEEISSSTPYIGLEHIPRKDFCLSIWGDASEINSNKYAFNKYDIIFGQIRPYFHKVGFAIVDGVASTDSFVMRPQENTWGLFLLTVSSEAFVNYSYQTCKEGAKMPRADWNQMKKYPLLVAESDIQRRFEEIICGIVQKVAALAKQNKLLEEARDRLLPKLMSGEIEV